VLAVGDAAFRRRCFAKIDEFVRAQKTIVIVSHNLAEVQRVARRLILIHDGLVKADDDAERVIDRYASIIRSLVAFTPAWSRSPNDDNNPAAPIQILGLAIRDGSGRENYVFSTHDDMTVVVRYVAVDAVVNPVFRVQIYRSDGVFCHGMNTARHTIDLGKLRGEGVMTLRYRDLRLLDGDYMIHAAVFLDAADELPVNQWFHPVGIHIESRPVDGGGVVAMTTEWSHEVLECNPDCSKTAARRT
jgi:hypothetical protein